jgi:hypothetical protein
MSDIVVPFPSDGFARLMEHFKQGKFSRYELWFDKPGFWVSLNEYVYVHTNELVVCRVRVESVTRQGYVHGKTRKLLLLLGSRVETCTFLEKGTKNAARFKLLKPHKLSKFKQYDLWFLKPEEGDGQAS